MKLWLLKARNGSKYWEPWYDKCFGMVILAESEPIARRIACENAFDEIGEAWLKPNHSTCEELDTDSSEQKIIMQDVANA